MKKGRNISTCLISILTALLFILPAILFSQSLVDITGTAKLDMVMNNNGVSVADIDQDNDLDLFIVTRQSPNNQQGLHDGSYLMRNNGDGTFTDITKTSGIQTGYDFTGISDDWNLGLKIGASWGDINNDGYPDLILANEKYLQLYENNGDGTFSDITEAAGFQFQNNCYTSGATWWDYNNDGFLDVYLTRWDATCGNIFMENQGDGTFVDRTVEMGLQGIAKEAWMSYPIDINEDGYMDLYVAIDFSNPCELYINQGAQGFVERAAEYDLTNFTRDGMGVTVGDVNLDGLFDMLITNIEENTMYINNGDGSFSDQSVQLGIHQTGWAWGCQFADVDHDTDEDLFIVNGYFITAASLERKDVNAFFLNQAAQGTMVFEDRSEDLGVMGETFSNGLTAFDFDNDGDQDIIFTNSKESLTLLRNNLLEQSETGTASWVKFKLEGTASNRDGIGSIVEVHFDDEVRKRYYTGANLYGQNLQPVHFGLGNSENISSVTVRWPSGNSETYTDLPVNSHYLITEGTGIETLNIETNRVWGCTDPNSCSYNPEATIDDGSCTYIDPGFISGPATANILSEQTYTYSVTDANHYSWTVTGGTITSGQGTPSVTIAWNIGSSGSISVVESKDCVSTPAALQVTLTAIDHSQHSVARLWNEALLEAIRGDFARPTVHARNLFHTSIAMYDAWSAITRNSSTYLLGHRHGNYSNVFKGFETNIPEDEAVRTAVSYAVYGILTHRFQFSPSADHSLEMFSNLMELLGYDPDYSGYDYQAGNPADLGNYIARSVIEFGKLDGSRESTDYDNAYYEPINPPLPVEPSGSTGIIDPNRWQPLQFKVFIDQSGNILSDSSPEFLNPEWGNVLPFSLKESQATTHTRGDQVYKVYMDPGGPPQLSLTGNTTSSDLYKWNFSLVALWSSHLDPSDGVIWDISPTGIGGLEISQLPTSFEDYENFYDLSNGGDFSPGLNINPITAEPYQPNLVPRGDYARVLAEFWADGPDSETPPGHWFTLINYVSDHPQLDKKMDPLEWDIKGYFALGGAMHDAAIAAWALKGWYDYIRPISAIRYMAEMGQSSDESLPNYHPGGIPLIQGYIEQIEEGDPLAGAENEHVGGIKLYSWRGHNYINSMAQDNAGVGWIRAREWWPYQRPSFVTPPFAGYVSGHSTFSRAAAEVLTRHTGSEYFPGGMGEFIARAGEFLVFEDGPSQDVVLQWARYQDASDQCSLSRIWGGIHPPADDIPGRIIGEKIGNQAYDLAERYFNGEILEITKNNYELQGVYPNPIQSGGLLFVTQTVPGQNFRLLNLTGQEIDILPMEFKASTGTTILQVPNVPKGMYILYSNGGSQKIMID